MRRRLMFDKKVDSELPDEYTSLNYIESTGTQYINSKYIFSSDSNPYRVVADFQLIEPDKQWCIFGTAQDTGNRYPFLFMGNLNQYAVTRYGSGGSGVLFGSSDTNRHLFEYVSDIFISSGDVFIDGVRCHATDTHPNYNSISGWRRTSNFGLFTRLRAGAADTSVMGNLRLFNIEFWSETELERRYIPKQRKSDGEIGMYESVTQEFFTNQGTGSFLGG